MANIFGICWLLILFFTLASGLTGTEFCIPAQSDTGCINSTDDNISIPDEGENTTFFDWTSFRNANQTITEVMDLNLVVNDPDKKKEIEYLSNKVKEEINRSFIYDSSVAADSIKYELFFIIRDPAYRYSGPVNLTENFYVTVFKTIPDPLISKPSFLSHEYIVKYNITYSPDSSQEKVKDTIWWYESDASRIVRYLMNSSIGDNIAVIVINFTDSADNGSITFVLEAEDLEKLKEYWDSDEQYISYFDWSEIVSDNQALVYYEDPMTVVDLPEDILSSEFNGDLDTFDVDENLKNDLRVQSYELMEAVDSIKRSVSAGNLEEIQENSKELIELSRVFSSEIEGYSVDDESKKLIEEYISGVRSLSKVGSHYWDKAFLPDELYDEGSIGDLNEGIEQINNVLDSIGEDSYDLEEMQIITSSSLVASSSILPAGTAFHYKDKAKNNDISIKITDYYLKSRLLIKKETGVEYQDAGFEKRYIGIVVDIMHLGYRGTGNQKITTPDAGSFTFYYDGNTYTTITVEDYIEDMGEVYSKRTLDRLERYESLIIFEIDDEKSFDPEKAFVEIDLGEYGKQIWRLSSEI